MQLLVLGCHRSGTSACTRLLNMMGASVGAPESMKAANKENPKGFWENDEVVDINKLLLQQAGARWDRLSGYSPEAATAAFAQAAPTLGRELERLVLRFDVTRPWVTKDPRLCLTLPFWLPYLEQPVAILMNRHPIEVARSMNRRNALLTVETGIALWEKYSLCALADSRGVPRVHLTHQQLMRDPAAAVRHLLEQLEAIKVTGLRLPSDAEIAAFIDPKLQREHRSGDEESALLNPQQAALHAALESGEALQWTTVPELSASAQAALEAYDAAVQAEPERLLAVNRWNLGRLLDTRDELLRSTRNTGKLEKELKQVEAAHVALRADLGDRDKEIARLVALSREQAQRARKLETRLADHDDLRAKYSARCDAEAEYRDEIRQLREALAAVYREVQTLDGSMWTRLGLRVKLLKALLGLGPLRPELPIDRAKAVFVPRMAQSEERLRRLKSAASKPASLTASSNGERPNRHAYQEDIEQLRKLFDRLAWCIEAMHRQPWWQLLYRARTPLWALGMASDANRRTLDAAAALKQGASAFYAQAAQRARKGAATRAELEQDLQKSIEHLEKMHAHIKALEGSRWWRMGVSARTLAGKLGVMKRDFRLPTTDAGEAMQAYRKLRDAMKRTKNRYVIQEHRPERVREALPETPDARPVTAKVFLLAPPGHAIDAARVHALIADAGYGHARFRLLAPAPCDALNPAIAQDIVADAEQTASLDHHLRASDADLRVALRADASLPKGWLAALVLCAEAEAMRGMVTCSQAVLVKRSAVIKCGPLASLNVEGQGLALHFQQPLDQSGFSSMECDLSTAASAPGTVMRPRAVDALLNLQIHTGSVFHQAVADLKAHSAENLDEPVKESEDAVTAYVLANRHAGGQPLVSIIMPAYNREDIIGESIRSVLEQTWQHWELLVCDDGSDDGTVTAARAFNDPRIRVLELPHGGAAKARNGGLAEARGEYIAYLDSDNLWHPAFLEVMAGQLLRHTGHYCVFAKYLDVVVHGDGSMQLKRHTDADFSYEQLQERNFVDLNSFVHRASLYREFGGFTDALPRMQDWDLVLKYTFLRDPLYVDAYLTFYRRNEAWGQITHTQRHRDDEARGLVRANLDAHYKTGMPVVRAVGSPRRVTILSWDICRNHFSKAYNLAEALHRSGEYEVQLIGFRFFDEPIFEPYVGVEAPFETLYFEGKTLPDFEPCFARALMAVKGDVVYCVKPRFPSLGLGLLANYHFGKPVVMEANDSEVHVHKAGTGAEDQPLDPDTADPADAAWRNPYSLEWSRMMDGFATALPYIVTHNRNLHAHYGARSFYIRNLKDETWYDPTRYDREAIRRELGFKPTDRVILFGGLIRKHKGVFTLVDLVRDLGADQYKLLFVGSRNSPDLEKLKTEYANETVILPPQGRNEMAKINYAADLVVLWLDPDVPASHYQMPYKLTDALAMKVPVIANDISDLGELARQGYLRLVPHGDMGGLIDAVRLLFDHPEDTKRMVEAGRRLYLRQFCYAAAKRNFDLIYDAAMRQPAVLPVAATFAEWYARVHEALKSNGEHPSA